MAEIHCPMCSRVNAEELENCQFCGARLKPLLPSSSPDSQSIKPGEEPVKKPTSEFERAFPPTAGEESIHAGEEPTKKNTGELEQALPTWLRTLRQGKESANEQPTVGAPDENHQAEPASQAGESNLPDWLAGLEAGEKEEREEVPDWLAGLQTQKEDVEKEETPDWLEGIRKEGPVVKDATAAVNEPIMDRGIDWLSRLGGKSAEKEPPAGEPETLPPEPQAGPAPVAAELSTPEAAKLEEGPIISPPPPRNEEAGEGLPDWLAGLTGEPEIPTGESPAPSIEQAVPAEEFPEWLLDLKRKAAAPTEEATVSSMPPAEELPEWLSKLQGEGGVPAEATASSAFIEGPEVIPPATGESEPDWLSKLQAEGGMQEETSEKEVQPATEPLPAEPVTPETVPEWLAGVEKGSMDTTGGTPALIMERAESGGEAGETVFSMETPDWLTSLKPEESSAPVQPEGESVETPAEIPPAELPSWVQAMRPVESVVGEAKDVDTEETPPETQGPLAGLRGVLPAGVDTISTRKLPAHSVKLQVGENQQHHAAQLERMIEGENEHRPAVTSLPVRPARLLRWIIAAVLILAVALPIVTGMQVAPALTPFNQESLVGIIGAIPTNSPVLIAFDYEPALISELEAAAAPLIDHLILVTGARLTLVSSSPTGPLLAEHFIQTAETQHHYQAGQQYVNLGYLAGGPVGVRGFIETPHAFGGTEAWQLPPLEGIQKLSDYAAIIILTDNPDTGRVWIEQAGPKLGGKPMIMVISAQAEPLIQPYYDSGQIQGLVTGLAGGKAYEQTLPDPGAGLGLKYWGGFSMGLFAAVMVIFIGGVWSAFSAWRARRAGRKDKV